MIARLIGPASGGAPTTARRLGRLAKWLESAAWPPATELWLSDPFCTPIVHPLRLQSEDEVFQSPKARTQQ
jgi:hypothetical protein